MFKMQPHRHTGHINGRRFGEGGEMLVWFLSHLFLEVFDFVPLEGKYQSQMRKRYCLAKLISHTLAHMGKDIHLQRAQVFLRSDFVVKKTFVSRGPGSTTQSAIKIWQRSSSFPCYSQPGKPTQVAWAIKNRGA